MEKKGKYQLICDWCIPNFIKYSYDVPNLKTNKNVPQNKRKCSQMYSKANIGVSAERIMILSPTAQTIL